MKSSKLDFKFLYATYQNLGCCSFSQSRLFDPGGNWLKKDNPCPFHLMPTNWCEAPLSLFFSLRKTN